MHLYWNKYTQTRVNHSPDFMRGYNTGWRNSTCASYRGHVTVVRLACMHSKGYSTWSVCLWARAIAISSLPVQRIEEDCSGRMISSFRLAQTKHTDAARLRGSENWL